MTGFTHANWPRYKYVHVFREGLKCVPCIYMKMAAAKWFYAQAKALAKICMS